MVWKKICKVDWILYNPKEKHPILENKRQAYKNPEWLGAPESRHIRIMYLGEALGVGKLR